jgi:outer membrane receptor protein involved in Fe transport
MYNKHKFRHKNLALLIAALCAAPAAAFAEKKAETLETAIVEVVGTTPLPSIGATLDQVPANVQVGSANEISEQHTLDLAEYMNANLGSVTITEGQSNVYMPDVNFRGYTATPLMGAPVGLSVFMDGVRVNEPFGDGVNWGAIPQSAIANINLIPGSNPVFGLNTLGGALSIHTKSGSQFPGFAAEATTGSWGRRGFNAEYGGAQDNLEWFMTGNVVSEDGWRDHSPSQVNQLFGKFGWENESTDLDLGVLVTHNNLEGIQALPKSWMNTPEQAYTWPDRNDSDVAMLNLEGTHYLTDDKLVSGNVYGRHSRIKNFASNTNDDFDPSDPLSAQGFNEKSNTDQDGYGFAVQYSDLGKLWNYANQLTVGLSFDGGRSKYKSFEQEVDEFEPNRAAPSDDPFEMETDVTGRNEYYGLYFTDIFSITDKLHLTTSGRYNYIKVKIQDNMDPELITDPLSPYVGQDLYVTGTTSDEVEHRYNRFNPAIGLNYNPSQALTMYGAYNEGMRAPTPIELACANKDVPCRLPTDFLADPPLKKVVAKTWEGGLRGMLGGGWQWNATGFYSTLHDDIQFISAGTQANFGYFQNVGKTRRKGVELGLNGSIDKLTLAANYTYLRATYESDVVFNSPANSSANADGEITAKPGDSMPGLPDHALKIRAAYDFTPDFNVGMNMLSFSGVYARGDENNADENGKVAGYTIFNMDANYRIGKGWSAFLKATNIFDKDYATLGVLGVNAFNAPDRTFNTAGEAGWANELFLSPGSPQAAWVGVRYEFDKPKREAGTQLDND